MKLECYLNYGIEKSRKLLNDTIVRKNHNLLDEEVIYMSQELDNLIYKYQYLLFKKYKKGLRIRKCD